MLAKNLQWLAETTPSVCKGIWTLIIGFEIWAVVSQSVLDTLHVYVDSLLKCDCWFWFWCYQIFLLLRYAYLCFNTYWPWEQHLRHLKKWRWHTFWGTIVGFGCFSAACQVFLILRYLCKMFTSSVLTLRNCLRSLAVYVVWKLYPKYVSIQIPQSKPRRSCMQTIVWPSTYL